MIIQYGINWYQQGNIKYKIKEIENKYDCLPTNSNDKKMLTEDGRWVCLSGGQLVIKSPDE